MAVWKAVDLFLGTVITDDVRAAADSYQFVWVDGRDHNIVRRVIINQAGEIIAGQMGVAAPTVPASVTAVKTTEDDASGTNIPTGSIFTVCYTYVDYEEQESNPSPLAVFDTLLYMKKGYWLLDEVHHNGYIDGAEYVPDNEIHGCIESISLTLTIDSPGTIKRVNVYLAHAPYKESIIPITNMLLVSSQTVLQDETTKNIKLVAPASPTLVSYENDIAPKGDDITLVDGVTFVANANNIIDVPGGVIKLWAITLMNSNAHSYYNQFIQLDLYDAGDGITAKRPAGAAYLTGLDWDAVDLADYRMFDSDMVTPLEVYHYPLDAAVKLLRGQSLGNVTDASVTIGVPADNNYIRYSFPGVAGNAIQIHHRIGTQIASVIIGEDPETELIYTTAVDRAQTCIEYVDSLSGGLTITVDGITITVDFGGATVTGADLLSAIETAMGTTLLNIISEITGGDGYVGTTALGVTAAPVYFAGHGVSIVSVLDAGVYTVNIYVAYDSTTATFRSPAQLVAYKANHLPIAGNYLSARVVNSWGGTSGGFGVVVSMASAELLTGGEGTYEINTDAVQTRLLALIRIPYIPAYVEKTIYLAEVGYPALVSRSFVELITGTAGAGEMNIGDFYRDIVVFNPLRNEADMINTSAALIPYLDAGVGSPNYENRSLLSNKANANYYNFTTNQAHQPAINESKPIAVPDDYARDQVYVPLSHGSLLSENNAGKYLIFPRGVYATPSEGTLIFHIHLDEEKTPSDMLILEHDLVRILFAYDYYHLQLYFDPEKLCFLLWARCGDPLEYSGTEAIVLDIPGVAVPTESVTIAITWKQILLGATAAESQLEVGLHVAHPDWYIGEESVIPSIAPTTDDIEVRFRRAYTVANLPTYHKYLYAAKEWSNSVYHYTGLPTTVERDFPAFSLLKGEKLEIDAFMLSNIARGFAIFPTTGIGAYNEFAVDITGTTMYYLNTGASISTMQINTRNAIGKIQWGQYGAMPDLNEYPLNEEILRIAPLKSAQPTDEHNTIIIFTRNGDDLLNVYRLSLIGTTAEGCSVIRELTNMGLVSADAMSITNSGIVWLSRDGIKCLSNSGISNISSGIMEIPSTSVFVYDYINNWLWVIGTNNYVFQLLEQVWWQYYQAVSPGEFLDTPESGYGFFNYADNIIYEHGDTASAGNYVTKIVTRAIAVVRKLGRHKLITSTFTGTYKYLVRLFGKWITGGTSVSAQYTAYNHAFTSAPNTKSDYAQIEITECDNVIAITTEDEHYGKSVQ